MNRINSFFMIIMFLIQIITINILYNNVKSIKTRYVKLTNNLEYLTNYTKTNMEQTNDYLNNQKRAFVDKKDINVWLEKNKYKYINTIIPFYLDGNEFNGYNIFYQENENIIKNIAVDKLMMYDGKEDKTIVYIVYISFAIFVFIFSFDIFLKFLMRKRENG